MSSIDARLTVAGRDPSVAVLTGPTGFTDALVSRTNDLAGPVHTGIGCAWYVILAAITSEACLTHTAESLKHVDALSVVKTRRLRCADASVDLYLAEVAAEPIHTEALTFPR